ncbi:MAG: hypothetical protein ABIF40_00825 [archaeon]
MRNENRIRARTLFRDFMVLSYTEKMQKEIGQGDHGIVYDLGSMAMKIAHDFIFGAWSEVESRRKWFSNEFEIGKELHQQGFLVPEMYKLDSYSGKPFIVMEMIHGSTAQDYIVGRPNEKSRIIDYYEALLERVVEIGYTPDGKDLTNVIVESSTKKLYLIDFSLWERNE